MKLLERLALILIGGVVLTSLSFANIVVQPQATRVVAVDREDANAIAEQITVMIDGPGDDEISKGSGVIVRREGNVYYVITNKHVIEKEGNYQLQTVDGNRYVVNYRQIQKLPGLDLAVIQFSSNKNYRVAQLGDSDRVSRRQEIYVVGYATPGVIFNSRIFISAKGSIVSRVPAPKDGYALAYILDIVQPGMSGGPVLNQQGQLIGINGLAERDARTGRTELIAGIPSNSFSNNLAAIVPLATQPSPIAASPTRRNQFFCGISEGKPATIVRTSRGNVTFIVWINPDLTSGLSPKQRCETVSSRFEQFNDNGLLRFLKAGIVGERPVLCVSREGGRSCSLSDVLIFLSSGTDANAVLEKLLEKRNRARNEPVSL
ncbi:MAG: COP23 domain-containing protein [Microcoleus sp.]